MNGELHEISVAIGELRAEVKTLFHKHSNTANSIDARLSKIEAKMLAIDAEVSADVNDLRALKNRGWGLLIGVALAAGTAGATLSGKIMVLLGLVR